MCLTYNREYINTRLSYKAYNSDSDRYTAITNQNTTLQHAGAFTTSKVAIKASRNADFVE